MARIQLRGRIVGSAPIPTVPPPLAREPMWSRGGFTNLAMQTDADVGGNELAISDGANTVPLVSHRRQLELRGDQAILGGVKTFPLPSLSIEGGDDGQVLTTNGNGVLRWATPQVGTDYTFGRGLTLTGGTVDLNYATTGPGIGGVFVPTTAPLLNNLPAGLFLNVGTGELRLAIAGNATIGGVYVPGGLPPLGGLSLDPDGALRLVAATAANRGGVFIPPAGLPPAGGLGLAGNGALSLQPGSATVRGGCYVPVQANPPDGGLTISPDGGISLNPGTGTIRGGCYVPADVADPPGLRIDGGGGIRTLAATTAIAQTGDDNARPITSQVLQLGPDPGRVLPGHPSLPTSNKTILGAISELHTMIQGATGQLTIVGTFDASSPTWEVTPITGSPHGAGSLQTASQQNLGWFLIVDTEGTPTGRTDIPSVLMREGDLIICVEDSAQANTYHWGHLAIGRGVITASNVVLTEIPTMPGIDNVQDAIEELEVKKAERPLLIDAVSLSGNGQTTDLAVNIVDGGTF